MSRTTHEELPAQLLSLLDGTDLAAKVGETVLLVTVSESGWPHLAMLSVGELLATSPKEMVMALWRGTTSGTNLKRDGKATFVTVLGGAGHYIESVIEFAGPVSVNGGELDGFRCSVSGVLVDEVDYARLTSGITFSLPDPDSVIPRWQATVDAMRSI